MIRALALALLTAPGAAWAQNSPLPNDCAYSYPVAGTAGYANGRDAVRTNATTYAAGSFARRRLGRDVFGALDMHAVWGAAMVPSYCEDSDSKYYQQVFYDPLDLYATNLGFKIPIIEKGPANMRLRLFYASSVTTSTSWNRIFTVAAPMFNLYPALAAPLVGSTTTGRGLGTYGVDWIGGAQFRSDVVSVQAGYTGQRGLYADVTQEKVSLFVNGVVDRLGDGITADDLAYAMGGVEQLDPTRFGAKEELGMPSLFYRQLPQRARPDDDVAADANPVPTLRSGHARQEDILRHWDANLAWQFGPGGSLRELTAAWHTDGWHLRADEDPEDGPQAFVRAGVVNLADQPLLGVKGGPRPHLRAVYRARNDIVHMDLSAYMNDPALLDLYPFATNALGVNFELSMVME